MTKVTRKRIRIRLNHSLAADEEIHCVMPNTIEEMDAMVARGELKKIAANLDKIIRP